MLDVRPLQAEFDQVPGQFIEPKNREQIEFSMQVNLKYADLGIAEAKFRGQKFDEVLKATENVVKTVIEQGKKAQGEPIRIKDYRITGDIIGLALRANVQNGNADQGKKILDVLQRLSGLDEQQRPSAMSSPPCSMTSPPRSNA